MGPVSRASLPHCLCRIATRPAAGDDGIADVLDVEFRPREARERAGLKGGGAGSVEGKGKAEGVGILGGATWPGVACLAIPLLRPGCSGAKVRAEQAGGSRASAPVLAKEECPSENGPAGRSATGRLRPITMLFASREDAGRKLGRELVERKVAVDLVLGLPRGGLVVAAEVARLLRKPLDALVVRKVGHPRHREFAVGSLAEPDIVIRDEIGISVEPDELAAVVAEEKARLRDYQRKFHRHGPPDMRDKTVLLVDDGLATGATMAAAVQAARKLGARKVLVAVPVASSSAWDRLAALADQVLAVHVDPEFMAVGQYYRSFPQTTDEEVKAILGTGNPAR